MRTPRTLPFLLVVAMLAPGAAVAAQESPSPSASAGNPALPDATPTCLEAFTDAFASPALSPDATSETDAPDAHDLMIDVAIRACSSLEEWILTSIGYIMTNPTFDPTAPLLVRCADPAADLGGTPICLGLGVSPPQPVATSSEEPVASPSPTPSPQPTASPSPTLTPSPTPSPTSIVEVALVQVPRNLKVKVPGSTRIRYFDIKGQTGDEVLAAAVQGSASHCNDSQAAACALQSWRARAYPKTDPRTGVCKVARATTILDSTIWVPRWVPDEPVTAEMLDWWKQVLKKIATHEGQHVKILKQGMAKYRTKSVGKPCSSVQALVQQAYDEIAQTQDRFDEQDFATPWPLLPGMTFFD